MPKKAGSTGKSADRTVGKPLAPPWSVPIVIEQIPDAGLHRELEASAQARAAVAALAEVRDVSALSASLELERDRATIRVTGRVRGRVGQNCVVTLDPIETEIDEPVEATFALPAAQPSAGEPGRHNAADELPEPLTGNSIDLGALATEFLILGIDPYPRKAGVEFAPPAVETDDPHPFAALAALKNGSDGDKT
jgi:uncharacterized metal-binding protein YceD (DUF177 family)